MSKKSEHKNFFWERWEAGVLPELEDHSDKKLDLLRDYLVLYLEIVMKGTAGKEEQFVTLIDGFAGGGLYKDDRTGSPIAILEAVQEAEVRINSGREKKTRITPICYFIEKDPKAFACLEATLRLKGYGDRIGRTIHLRQDSFESAAPSIIADINSRHTRGGNRTIFFLDQCGYTEISALAIRNIFEKLHRRPEFIVNFAISWLTDFMSEKTKSQMSKSIQKLGLGDFVNLSEMMGLRNTLGGHWEHAVEAHIGEGFHKATGISYFSPFYIEPGGNHRGYWLVHLADSARARSAMMEIHWSKANRSKHYGHIGYDMLSYKPNRDQTMFIEGMSFNDESRLKCENALLDEIPRMISKSSPRGITYGSFINCVSNKVIATAPMLNDAVLKLCENNDFELTSPSGKAKKSSKITDGDIILPRKQMIFPGFKAKSLKLSQMP